MSSGSATTLSSFESALDPCAIRRAAALPPTARLNELREALDAAQLEERLRADGLVVLTGLDALPLEHWPELFASICGELGRLLPQSMTDPGQVIREVRYQGGGLDERTIRYSGSRSGGSYHTDGVPMPGPVPDLMALLCVRQAASGGEVVFIDSSAALDAATGRMRQLPVILRRSFHFDQRRTDFPDAAVIRRVVDSVDSGDHLIYLRDYIESGHAIPGVRPLAPEEILAMDILDEVLDDEALHIEGRLCPGQIAICDNHRYLHGRHEFPEEAGEEGGRLMLRCWVRTSRSE